MLLPSYNCHAQHRLEDQSLLDNELPLYDRPYKSAVCRRYLGGTEFKADSQAGRILGREVGPWNTLQADSHKLGVSIICILMTNLQ